jgi:ubiquinone/menaquinone biosynthesis C-methylase UbiE
MKPQLEIDAFDLSTSMNAIARDRIARSQPKAWESRIRILDADALAQPLAEHHYCAVFTHFFLDCFSEQQLASFLPSLRRAMCPGAIWIISEFQLPAAGLKRWHALVWLNAMYAFFQIATELRTTHLPNYAPLLAAEGWCLSNGMTSMADLVSSELWTYSGLKAGENPPQPSP